MAYWLEVLGAGGSPALIWGLVPRIIGGLYVIAFASLAPQILGLVGSRGVAPVREQLAAMRQHFPGAAGVLRLPTLLWLRPTDGVVRALPWLGMAAGLFAVFGGPGSWWALCACFVLYLSLDVAALMFPWDCLLFEAGFLALFLPETQPLPELASATLPLPLAAFALRLLMIRLMWGFAKLKFIGTKRGDSLYLRGFLAWMPMCTPLGHWMQQMPAWVLRAAYGFMWFVEVVCPGLCLLSGAPRLIGGVGLMMLMAGIWSTGNWGFFNLGYGALCIVMFDTQSSLFDTSWALVTSSPGVFLMHALLVVHTLCALAWFPNNSWGTHAFVYLPLEQYFHRRPLLVALLNFFRAILPFRMFHSYGVFPPNSSAPIKFIPVFEGSADGVTYRPYPYRFMPIAPHSRPPVVAPHHPRIDHLCVYAGAGMSDCDYLASILGAGKLYGFATFSHYSWLHRIMQRLLEGEPAVRGLFGHDPFPDGPPRFCRVSLRALTPNPAPSRRDEPWQVRDCGVILPARTSSDLVFRHWLAPPELLHPDAQYWRGLSPALRAMLREHRAGTPHEAAVRAESDLSPQEVTRFWAEFVPFVARGRGDFDSVNDTAAALREHFGQEGIFRMERVAERYVYLLRSVVEPYFLGSAEPKLPERFSFDFHLLLQELLLDGKEAFEAMLANPSQLAARAERSTEQSLLHFIGVVRNEMVRYHARTLRLSRRVTNVFESGILGILEHRDLLTRRQPPEETWLPECACSDSGVWRCDNFSPTGPDGHDVRDASQQAHALPPAE
jgi:hypothetical protein